MKLCFRDVIWSVPLNDASSVALRILNSFSSAQNNLSGNCELKLKKKSLLLSFPFVKLKKERVATSHTASIKETFFSLFVVLYERDRRRRIDFRKQREEELLENTCPFVGLAFHYAQP